MLPQRSCHMDIHIMDTGTSCNKMSIADLNKLVPNAKLRRSESRFHLYDGSHMKPLGVYSMYAKYQERIQRLRFEIVSTAVAHKPLLSANTCQKIGLISINVSVPSQSETVSTAREVRYANESGVQQSSSASADVCDVNKHEHAQGSKYWTMRGKATQIMDKYTDVFEGLGCLAGELQLEIDSSVSYVQYIPRKIPLAIRSEVNKIDNMVKRGVLSNVDEPTD